MKREQCIFHFDHKKLHSRLFCSVKSERKRFSTNFIFWSRVQGRSGVVRALCRISCLCCWVHDWVSYLRGLWEVRTTEKEYKRAKKVVKLWLELGTCFGLGLKQRILRSFQFSHWKYCIQNRVLTKLIGKTWNKERRNTSFKNLNAKENRATLIFDFCS